MKLLENHSLKKKNSFIRGSSKEAIAGILFTLPVVLGIIIFVFYPMLSSLYLSFTDYNILTKPQWIGLTNYISIFTEDLFFKKSLFVTFYYAIGSVAASIISAFGLAILLNQNVKGQSVFRTIFYIPSVVPAVASSMLWLWLFNPDFGLLNVVLNIFGLPKSMWIFGESTVIPSMIIMAVWSTGNAVVIFLAGLQDVPRQLLEAVSIDGGNWFHRFIHVTIPMTTPIIFFNLVMGIIGAFQTFTQAFVMTNGGPNNGSLFYVFYLYREGFRLNQMGYACALAWIMFFIILLLSLLIFKTSKSWVYYGGEND
jgi:multiple sugar transport system permease protein